MYFLLLFFFFFQAEDGIRDADVTGVQTCALPISHQVGKRALGQIDQGREHPPGMSAAAATDNRYTRGIAEFVSGLAYEAIPREVRERIKLLILDSLGCALYGAHLEWCRILQRTLKKLDGSTACGVWGTAQRLSAPHAALANGTQVQGFELDDVHREE